MKIVALIVLIVGVVAVIACAGDQSAPTPTSVPAPTVEAGVNPGVQSTVETPQPTLTVVSQEHLIQGLFQCVNVNPHTAKLLQATLGQTAEKLGVQRDKLAATFEDWNSFHALMLLVFREEPSLAEEIEEEWKRSYQDTVACQSPGNEVLGRVNEAEFTAGDLVHGIGLLQAVNRYRGRQTDLDAAPFERLEQWIFAEILRQQAPGLGIQPSEDAIARELLSRFRPVSASGLEPNTESLDRESGNNYQSFLNASGISDSDYRIIVEEDLALLGLGVLLTESIPASQEQVEARWIYIPWESVPEMDIDQIVRRIDAEGLSSVAQETHTADSYADSSGYVGWVPRGAFPDLDPLLYGDDERGISPLTPGETSSPVFAADGVYIINVLSGTVLQELSDKMRVKLTGELTQAWQEEQLRSALDGGTVMINFNSRIYEWISDQAIDAKPTPR